MKAKTKRILIVDDEPEAVAAVERAGIELMCEVATLDHTKAFERVVTEWSPDIVVLDVGIPDRDGYALFGVLSDLRYDGGVVVISGMPQQDLQAAARIAQMRGLKTVGVVRKPIGENDMLDVLTKAKA